VRDFAWAAGTLEQAVDTAGTPKVVVSYRAGTVSQEQAKKMLAAARQSVTTFSASFGAYPYPELDVVLGEFPDFGGMEYPTIVFSEVDKWTVAHEIAHQWWYGLVGNDQYAFPWLDESLATWSGELPFGGWVGCASYDFPGAARLTADMDYWGDHPSQYDTVYDGGGCMLANLAKRFGRARFVDILEGYAAAHWLGIARTGDFTTAIEKAAAEYLPGFDIGAFWATWRVDAP
jgi:aminopeptidase N